MLQTNRSGGSQRYFEDQLSWLEHKILGLDVVGSNPTSPRFNNTLLNIPYDKLITTLRCKFELQQINAYVGNSTGGGINCYFDILIFGFNFSKHTIYN